MTIAVDLGRKATKTKTNGKLDIKRHSPSFLQCQLLLPGKALRKPVDIMRLAELFNKRSRSRAWKNLISKDANLVFYLSAYQVDPLFKLVNRM